jgi:NAD(P)-dependent dehydrogenase (short-subunit alcohol dehydrogenase family)
VKAGVDKMAHDMAVDFEPFNVTVVSVWMGLLRTERTKAALERYGSLATESPEFTGRLIAALAGHPDRMRWTGRVAVGAELGEELGVVDIDGTAPRSHRPSLGAPTTYNSAVVD